MATTVQPSAERIPRSVWVAASVMALAGFLGNMDGPVVAVGLESMRIDLHSTLDAIQWVTTAYLLGLAAALPLTPWLVRRLGAGRLWLLMLALFLVTSAICALMPSAALLIAARTAQGMVAGILITAGQTVIGIAVGPARLGRVMGTLGLVVGLAPLVGPSVGGLLLARFSWPVLFWLNLPIGLITLALGLRFVPRGDTHRPPPPDYTGLALISLGLPLLVFALTELGSSTSATSLHVLLAVAGLGACALFVRRCLNSQRPVLNLQLLGGRVMACGLLTVALASAGMLGATLLLPLWMQIRTGSGSAATGLSLISLGLGTTVIMIFAGRLTDRYGGGRVALVGTCVVAASTVPWLWLDQDSSTVLIQILLLVRGMGMGLSLMPAMTAAYASVRAEDLGDATALANIVMRVAGAVGGALCVVVLSRVLGHGADVAFRAAFIALGVTCLLAVVAAAFLRRAEIAAAPR